MDKFRHQLLISARFLIAQIVALVYHNQNLLSRLKIAQLGIGVSLLHTVVLHIGMETDDIVELILLETGVATAEILVPVLLQLLWTEQDCKIILSLEIFDDSQCREGFTKTHSIGKDSSIILTEHFYQRDDTLLLVIEKRVPNHTGLQKLHILSVFNAAIQVEIGIEQLEEYLIIDFLWCIFSENFLYLLDKVLFHIYLRSLRFLSILWHFFFCYRSPLFLKPGTERAVGIGVACVGKVQLHIRGRSISQARISQIATALHIIVVGRVMIILKEIEFGMAKGIDNCLDMHLVTAQELKGILGGITQMERILYATVIIEQVEDMVLELIVGNHLCQHHTILIVGREMLAQQFQSCNREKSRHYIEYTFPILLWVGIVLHVIPNSRGVNSVIRISILFVVDDHT